MPFWGDMLVPWRVCFFTCIPSHLHKGIGRRVCIEEARIALGEVPGCHDANLQNGIGRPQALLGLHSPQVENIRDSSLKCHFLFQIHFLKKNGDTPLWRFFMEHNHGGLEDTFLSKWVICRLHVNLPGCSSLQVELTKTIYQMKIHHSWISKTSDIAAAQPLASFIYGFCKWQGLKSSTRIADTTPFLGSKIILRMHLEFCNICQGCCWVG